MQATDGPLTVRLTAGNNVVLLGMDLAEGQAPRPSRLSYHVDDNRSHWKGRTPIPATGPTQFQSGQRSCESGRHGSGRGNRQ